jgi:hypothetical protein
VISPGLDQDNLKETTSKIFKLGVMPHRTQEPSHSINSLSLTCLHKSAKTGRKKNGQTYFCSQIVYMNLKKIKCRKCQNMNKNKNVAKIWFPFNNISQ